MLSDSELENLCEKLTRVWGFSHRFQEPSVKEILRLANHECYDCYAIYYSMACNTNDQRRKQSSLLRNSLKKLFQVGDVVYNVETQTIGMISRIDICCWVLSNNTEYSWFYYSLVKLDCG